MYTRLYYYTGTGNSLWVSRQLGQRLDGEVELVSLGTAYLLPDAACDRVGIIFPVHMWGMPRRVVEFVRMLTVRQPARYYFAVAVHAGQVAATLLQLQKLLQRQEIKLGLGFELLTPSNYILWNGAQSEEKQQALFAKAGPKLDRIVAAVRKESTGPVEKGPWWQNVFLSGANQFLAAKVHRQDKDFWSDEKCNSCGLCAQVCPAANISLEAGRPVWQSRCEQCLACIQWCPLQAVQYAKKTAGKKRYHHPMISAADMIAAAKKAETHE